MPGIGEIRIDFIADLAKFVKGTKEGGNAVDRFVEKSVSALHHLETQMERLGARLTAKVTLPLIGLAVAAVKAADPAGQVGESLERLRLQAGLALKPLGEVLIRMFEEARPTLERGVMIIHNFSQAFAELDPHTQRFIVNMAIAAASAGPILLLGSTLLTVLKGLGEGLKVLLAVSEKLLLGLLEKLPIILELAIGIVAVFAAFEFGRYLYDQSTWVQKAGVMLALALNDIYDAFGAVKDLIAGEGGAATKAQLKENWRINREAAQQQNADIDKQDAAGGPTGRGFVEGMKQDLTEALDLMQGKWADFKDLFTKGADLPFVQTKKDIDEINKSLAEAIRIADEVDPRYGLWGKLAGLQDTNDKYPGMLDPKKFSDAAEKIKTQLLSLGDTFDQVVAGIQDGIKGAGSQVAQSFADMVVSGKMNFGELLKSWEITLVKMASEKAIFGPLADSLSKGFGNLFNGGGTLVYPGPGQQGPPQLIPPNAMGGVFGPGGAIPFARGGVVNRPTLFPFAGGTGLMGEAGPEAIMPLRRGAGGRLGVAAAGGGTSVQIIDQRGAGAVRPQVSQSTGPDGRQIIRVMLRDEVTGAMKNGSFDRTLRGSFGVGRQATNR